MATDARRDWGRPAGGPWWRFVPKSKAAGYVGLLAGVLLVVQSLVELVQGGNSGLRVVLEVVILVLGVALILQAVDGLRIRGRRHPS